MKLSEINKNGNRLKIFLSGDVYAMDMYRSFNSVAELREWVVDNYGVYYKNRFSYWY